ncbi:MAG: diaminobutyrate acetyltransferase [Acidobacteria bacterium]|nr:diaminobutyrate acetyltransferase [Acidobacteriota bacterium]
MSKRNAKATASAVVYRKPQLADAAAIHALIDACKPLDLNSVYAYLLLCEHFSETCVVAEHEGRVAGFLSAYLKPADPTTMFVWQVAVGESVRGHGVGRALLAELLARPGAAGADRLETTITPSNAPSWALFRSFARRIGAGCEDRALFHDHQFGGEGHEEERLLQISPLRSGQGR